MGEELKRTLGFPTLLLVAINAIMGTGVFFLPAIGAREAGVVSILSWSLLSIMAIYISMCFAELASMFPTAGGIYEYCKQAFGEFPSFLVGWGTLIAGNITIAMLIVGAIRYLNPALGEFVKIAISLLFIFAFNYVAYKGMDISKTVLVAFAFITLGTLLAIIFPGLLKMSSSNFTPFFDFPMKSVFIAMFLIAETFFGWETITFLADETKNPKKTIPIALVLGTSIIAILCLLYVVSAIGAVGATRFGDMLTPLSELGKIYYGVSSSDIFSMLVYLSIIGSVAGWIVAAPRLLLSLAKDKLFVAQLAEIHPVNKTPHKAIVFQTLLTSFLIIVGSASYEVLLSLLLPLVILLYSAVLLALVVLRKRRNDIQRSFKAPMGNWLPILVIFANLALVAVWLFNFEGAFQIFRLMISFIILGIPVYLLLILFYNPDAIIGLTNSLSKLTLWVENLVLPKKVRVEVLRIFGDIRKKRILEFGCGVGTLTMHLAESVGPEGKIYSTDLSENNLRILKDRVERAGYSNIKIIHDQHQVNRVHPDIKYVDFVFSVGMLSYIQDVNKVLSEINKILPEHGKVCFVEYVNFFKILPDPPWMKNVDIIRKHFRDAGFSVYVHKIKGKFWNYLVVYGFKSDKDVPFV